MNKEYVEFKCGKNLICGGELIKGNEPPIRIGLTKEQFIEYQKLQQENKQLKDNWDKLKKYLNKKEKLTFNSWNSGIHEIQRKMQELEKGDVNE